MPAGGLTDKHLVIGAAGLTAMLVVAGALLAPPAGGVAGASSLSAAADGGQAAFETLRALGYQVERSYEPLASVRAEPDATVLLVTGDGESSEQDRRALSSFVENGGEVLLVGAQGAKMLGAGGATAPQPMLPPPVSHRALTPSPVAAGVPEITMRGDAGRPAFGPSWVTVFAVGEDEPLVTTARLGRGRATWWAAPTPLANAHVSNAGNLRILLNVAGVPGERLVLWDEYYHGHARSLWSYLVKTPLPWAGAQAGLIALAALAAFSRRRGPIRPEADDTRTSPLEFIEMLGALYRRSGAPGTAVAAARARLDRAARSHAGVPHDSPDANVARAIAGRTDDDERAVMELLAESRRAAGERGVETALDVVARLQRLTRRVTEGVRLEPPQPVRPSQEKPIVQRPG